VIVNAYHGISEQNKESISLGYSGTIVANYDLNKEIVSSRPPVSELKASQEPNKVSFAPDAHLTSGSSGLPAGIITTIQPSSQSQAEVGQGVVATADFDPDMALGVDDYQDVIGTPEEGVQSGEGNTAEVGGQSQAAFDPDMALGVDTYEDVTGPEPEADAGSGRDTVGVDTTESEPAAEAPQGEPANENEFDEAELRELDEAISAIEGNGNRRPLGTRARPQRAEARTENRNQTQRPNQAARPAPTPAPAPTPSPQESLLQKAIGKAIINPGTPPAIKTG
jgi:hypothetical protein